MYTPENDSQLGEFQELLKEIEGMEQIPEIANFIQKVKDFEKMKDKVKERFKKGEKFGSIGGFNFISKPEYGYTSDVIISTLGDRANEYLQTSIIVDKKKLEEDIKKGILPKDIEAKRIVTGSKIYFEKEKKEVQDTFNFE